MDEEGRKVISRLRVCGTSVRKVGKKVTGSFGGLRRKVDCRCMV